MFLRVIVCLMLLFTATSGGEVQSFAAEPCAERCPDDGDDGACAPTCDDCACCAHVRTVALRASGLGADVAAGAAAHTPEPLAAAPQPFVDEIFHVPKA